MLENFDGIQDNYKVELQIYVVIFISCFYITCLWVLELDIFSKIFRLIYAKMIKLLEIMFQNCIVGIFSHYRTLLLTHPLPSYPSISKSPPSVWIL